MAATASVTQQEYSVLLQNVRKTYVKIDLLDFATERKIDELQGHGVGGNVNIKADSNCRRSASVSFVVENSSLSVGANRRFWIDRKIRIYIGLLDIVTGEKVWFNQGCFIVNNPTVSYSTSTNTISFEALDYMSMLDGTFSGNLQNITEILEGTDISDSISSLVSRVKVKNVERIDRDLPYTIRKEPGSTVYDFLVELNNLYMDWEFFFDVDGVFVFQKKRNKLNSAVVWNFDDTDDLVLSCSSLIDFANVKNRQVVWGRDLDNAAQIFYSVENRDPQHPFSIPSIGLRPAKPYINDKIFTIEQAKKRAEYELNERSNLREKLTIQCVPVYNLDVNRVIYFKSANKDIDGQYLINDITCPLSFDGEMTIQAHKIYEHLELE